ncbi:hypothetical protein C1645_807689 [Glomus cerebriforme]|uniref:Uncharacterized protein n=1 Tax=Glomus cerebriforme TaxID=658196 RepID=A0A397SKD6_9GLOM|nr:hypothetical protein C1645_807689 [Glomus cerebriforme]
MADNQLPSPQLTPPIIQNRQIRLRHNNFNNNITRSQDGYFMDWDESYNHMTTKVKDNSDEGTICSDEEEEEIEVCDSKLDEETICSDEIDYDVDMESVILNVSESEIENGSDCEYEGDGEYEDEESEENNEEIQAEEPADKISNQFFRDKVEGSKASLAFEILQELIDECILDVAFEMHRQAKTEKPCCTQAYQNRDSNLSYLINEQGYDIFGQNINTLRLQAGKQRCLNCNAMYPVTTDERTDKFSVFDFPEESSYSSFISNGEMDIDTQETCVTNSSNTCMFPDKRRVIKNTYARRRTMRQI